MEEKPPPLPHINAEQFDIVHQGASPLMYHRGGKVERIAAVHPEVEPPGLTRSYGTASSVPETEYWAPKVEVHMGARGRLKAPKVISNPSAAAPGTAAFLDYSRMSDDSLYVHFANTRRGFGGRGLAKRLVSNFAEMHPEHSINFGKVMSPAIWHMMESLKESGRDVHGKRDF